MRILKFFNFKVLLIFFFFNFLITVAKSEEETMDALINQIQIITKDLKTLEKAFYKTSDITTSSSLSSSDSLNEDILTKHLLKLNEIEDQFRELTNKFEEINFKLDKLSSRLSKVQADNQLRFEQLENKTAN